MLSSSLFFPLALLAAVPAAGASPDYSPQQIEQLVQSGKAVPHGGGFAVSAGALNSSTFFWEQASDHHVFFFLRDGKSHGEYRDEILADGRFMRIQEKYLVLEDRATASTLEPAGRRFICKDQALRWEAGQWTGSDVRWSLLKTSAPDANPAAPPESVLEEREVKRNVTLTVPASLMRPATEYYMQAYRTEVNDYEKAFGGRLDGEKYRLGSAEVSDGRCTLPLQWPESRNTLVFELHERIPADPRDANPSMIYTRSLGAMTVTGAKITEAAIVFKPR